MSTSSNDPNVIARNVIEECFGPDHAQLLWQKGVKLKDGIAQAILDAEKRGEQRILDRMPSEEEAMERFASHPDTHRAGALAMYDFIRARLEGKV